MVSSKKRTTFDVLYALGFYQFNVSDALKCYFVVSNNGMIQKGGKN